MVKTFLFTKTHLTVSDHLSTNTFELVDEVPLGYTVWNIGRHNMPAGYLPLCRLLHPQPCGARQIDVDSLKATKVKGAEYVLDVASSGMASIQKMETYMIRNKGSKDPWAVRQIERCKKAIPVLESLPGGQWL